MIILIIIIIDFCPSSGKTSLAQKEHAKLKTHPAECREREREREIYLFQPPRAD
jgi:hypothetical protein